MNIWELLKQLYLWLTWVDFSH